MLPRTQSINILFAKIGRFLADPDIRITLLFQLRQASAPDSVEVEGGSTVTPAGRRPPLRTPDRKRHILASRIQENEGS